MEKRPKKLGRREKNRGKNREKRNLTARSSPLLGVDKHSCCRQSGKRRNTSMVARQDCNFRVLVKPSTQLTKSWGAWRNAFMTIWLAHPVLKKAKQANRNLCKAAKMKDHKRSYGKEKTWKAMVCLWVISDYGFASTNIWQVQRQQAFRCFFQ